MNKSFVAAAASAALTLGMGIAPAQAHDRHESSVPTVEETRVIAEGLVSPLRLAVGDGRSIDVAQSFAGTVSRIARDGNIETLDAMEGYFAGSVSRSGRTTYYTMTKGAGAGIPAENESLLKSRDRHGNIRTIANIAAYEQEANPDQETRYGFRDLDQACLALQTNLGPRASYTGQQDSNPIATVPFRDHVLVADAGANAIFRVDRWGNVSTVAVLPAIPVTVTEEIAAAAGMDNCAVGATYYLEPVPTDLELGHRKMLHVSSLPGGPEDPSLGALGSVFTVNPWSGETRQTVTGLVSPTGLAIDQRGNLYVAELFANRISVVPRGASGASVLYEANQPAEVELKDGSTLYATTDVLGPENLPPAGKIIKIEIHKRGH
ncbi:ScyD/ScyE family protein [Arthrobacter sp. JZ12]|uniref:ScyD/ScyE family protein n=1 Tax=Arthrobacter sp. JZ12 TaxID=2654190 RepID=UPI002B4891BF|nr:ScyD/ScyE family protein [Arthrobacter sp. JZ12]